MTRVEQSRLRAILVLLGGLAACSASGSPAAGADESGGAYAAVHARRLLARADSDRDGLVDPEEAADARVSVADLDANGDGRLDEVELQSAPIRHLRTAGPRRLNLRYKQTPQEDLFLDLYLPASRNGPLAPVLVYTHGGGWVTGSKENIAAGPKRDVALSLLDAGFAVAAVNYRLCDADSGVVMRDCVEDARDAVRYLAAHADEAGIDPDRFLVFGDSAGGQIAQLILLLPSQGPQDHAGGPACRVRAGVSWYGPCDFQRDELFANSDGRGRAGRFASRIVPPTAPAGGVDALLRDMSPIAHLTAESGPLLLVHGDRDTTIPVGHARSMKKRADAVGAVVETLIVSHAGHNWRPVGGPITPPVETIVARTVAFLVAHGDRDPKDRPEAAAGRKPDDFIPASRNRSLK